MVTHCFVRCQWVNRGLRKPSVIPAQQWCQKRGQDLSDGSMKWSCVTVPSTASWAKDTGRVCGLPSPAHHGAASETPELVYLTALYTVLDRGWGTPAWLCAQAPLSVPGCNWPGRPQHLAGITKHQRGPGDLPKVPGEVCSRAKAQDPTQPAPGKCRATLVPAKCHQPSQHTRERGDANLGLSSLHLLPDFAQKAARRGAEGLCFPPTCSVDAERTNRQTEPLSPAQCCHCPAKLQGHTRRLSSPPGRHGWDLHGQPAQMTR